MGKFGENYHERSLRSRGRSLISVKTLVIPYANLPQRQADVIIRSARTAAILTQHFSAACPGKMRW